MRTRFARTLALFLALVTVTGCGSVGNYLANRGADFVDVFTAEASTGPGVHVHVQAALLGTVIGWSDLTGYMLHGRYYGTANRQTAGALVIGGNNVRKPDMTPVYGEDQYGWGPNDRERGWLLFLPILGGMLPGTKTYAAEWPRNFDIEFGMAIGLAAHVGLSPGEFMDFVLGFTTLDVADDDYHADVPRDTADPK